MESVQVSFRQMIHLKGERAHVPSPLLPAAGWLREGVRSELDWMEAVNEDSYQRQN